MHERGLLVCLILTSAGCELLVSKGNRKLATGGSTSSSSTSVGSTSTSGPNGPASSTSSATSSATSTTSSTSAMSSSSTGCTDTTSDVMNCGTCGNVCGSANGSQPPTCSGGTCVFSCASNYAHCQGEPDSEGCGINLLTDTNNCGACGNPPCADHCSKGFCCDLGYDYCPTGCVDLTNDAKNCGTCGHDCISGTCFGKSCYPFSLVTGTNFSGPDSPFGLAVDKDYLYWTDNAGKQIGSVAKSGSANPKVVGATPTQPFGIVSDGSNTADAANLYVVTSTGVIQQPVSGGAGVPAITSLATTSSSTYIAMDSGYLFWTAQTGSSAVTRYNLSTHTPTVLASVAAGTTSSPGEIAAANGSVLWADSGIGDIFTTTSSATACQEPSTCAAASVTKTTVVTMDSSNIYWAEGVGSWRIYRAPISNPTQKTLVARTSNTAGDSVAAMVSDGTTLYWSDGADGIYGNPINGAPCDEAMFTCVSLNPGNRGYQPTALAVDDKAVYWAFQVGPSGGTDPGIIWGNAK